MTNAPGQVFSESCVQMLDLDLKERVRSSVDLVDVIGGSLTLVPKGRMLAAQCPWHDDRSPSLTVNRERQTWKCWVCDIGGDVFSFVMRRDGVDFVTALRLLADHAGIEYQVGPKPDVGSKDDKATLLSAVKLVSTAYFDLLDKPTSDDAKIARDYLASRGIDDENRQRFQVGFAPDSWEFATSLLSKNKFRPEIATAAGVALNRNPGKGSYDLFRGRLMFPIFDMQNRPISMGGRVIPEIASRHGDNAGGKYINGPETKLFRKSQQLYGLNLAREAIRKGGAALVMEGYTDVIVSRQTGVEPVVAVLGTALGEDHVKLLKRLAQRVILVLDGDEAGQKRADEVLELFVRADADLRILTLPSGLDPADYLQQFGKDAFESLVDESPDALEHKLTTLTDGVDVTNDTHAVMRAIDVMTEILAKARSIDPLKLDQMVLRLSRTFGITVGRLQERLSKKRRELENRRRSADRFRKASANATSDLPPKQSQPFDPNRLLAEAGDHESDGFVAESPSPMRDSAAPVEPEQPLSGFDRELFETIIESPSLAARAVEAIDPDWLDTLSAKMLLAAYQELDLQGRDLDVESLLLLLENDFLKNEIVTLQFRLAERSDKLSLGVEERFEAVLRQYQKRETKAEAQRQIAQLEAAMLDEDEELELLKQLFDGERTRHEIDPKGGASK
ncbi:MAG: DNA primase [Planctomycetota bacterium]